MGKLSLGLILTLGLVVGGCARVDEEGQEAGYTVIYEGPPKKVEVTWKSLTGTQSTGWANVNRVEVHGEFVKLQWTDGRIKVWHEPLQVSVNPQ